MIIKVIIRRLITSKILFTATREFGVGQLMKSYIFPFYIDRYVDFIDYIFLSLTIYFDFLNFQYMIYHFLFSFRV